MDPSSVERLFRNLDSTDPLRRRQAQLLLSQRSLAPLPTPTTCEAKAYAALRRIQAAEEDAGVAPTHTGTTLVDRSDAFVRSVGRILGERLGLDPDELDRRNPDFAADYRRECLPRLEDPWRFLRDEDCREADLDGDGSPELMILGESFWTTHWIHDLNFGLSCPFRLVDFARFASNRLRTHVGVRAGAT